jgi:hypothetical protein
MSNANNVQKNNNERCRSLASKKAKKHEKEKMIINFILFWSPLLLQMIKNGNKKTLSIHKRIIKELQMTREKEREIKGEINTL